MITAMKELHPFRDFPPQKMAGAWGVRERTWKSFERCRGSFCPWGGSESGDDRQITSTFAFLLSGKQISGHNFLIEISSQYDLRCLYNSLLSSQITNFVCIFIYRKLYVLYTYICKHTRAHTYLWTYIYIFVCLSANTLCIVRYKYSYKQH